MRFSAVVCLLALLLQGCAAAEIRNIAAEDVLRRIASDNGGTFKYVGPNE